MTVLGRTDGDTGASYLDLADFIQTYGAAPAEDLRELWRRLVFTLAVSNTDCHLRNHGFLLTAQGWRLSPMYDVNPNPTGTALALKVSERGSAIDCALAADTAPYYGISRPEAARMIRDLNGTVKGDWERIAKRHGIRRGEIERMRPAFSAKL